jgi:excisionase family DNA binding protein
MDDTKQTLTLTETANQLGMSVHTIRRAIRENKLPFPTVQVRGRHLVSRKVLERYLSGEGQ